MRDVDDASIMQTVLEPNSGTDIVADLQISIHSERVGQADARQSDSSARTSPKAGLFQPIMPSGQMSNRESLSAAMLLQIAKSHRRTVQWECIRRPNRFDARHVHEFSPDSDLDLVSRGDVTPVRASETELGDVVTLTTAARNITVRQASYSTFHIMVFAAAKGGFEYAQTNPAFKKLPSTCRFVSSVEADTPGHS
jgi:hypothetical protein